MFFFFLSCNFTFSYFKKLLFKCVFMYCLSRFCCILVIIISNNMISIAYILCILFLYGSLYGSNVNVSKAAWFSSPVDWTQGGFYGDVSCVLAIIHSHFYLVSHVASKCVNTVSRRERWRSNSSKFMLAINFCLRVRSVHIVEKVQR